MIFKKQSPESVGISSKNIQKLITSLEVSKIPIHSLLIYRHNCLITEGYYAPYTRETLHRLFSVTKSFVSVAIGQLIQLGQIRLSDPVYQYFDEYTGEYLHPFIKSMTIEDLLKMETCHSSTTYKHDLSSNWVQSFFTTAASHRPGSHFSYDTSASHTLGALVKRLTGQNVLDFLRETFLKDSNFSPKAYIINDPFGEAMGGSGLMARPIDLLIFAKKVMEERKTNPYLLAATSNLTDTLIKGENLYEQQGYGYQFWQIPDKGYACCGMGGQYAICYPAWDLIIVTTADTQSRKDSNSTIFNLIKEHLLTSIGDQPLDESPLAYQELEEKLKNLLMVTPEKGTTKSRNQQFTLNPNKSSFKEVKIELDSKINQGILSFYQDTQVFRIPFGFGKGIISTFDYYKQKCFSYGTWIRSNRLHIKTHLIDECIGSIDFHLTFHKEREVSIFIRKVEETYFQEFNGYFEGRLKS